MLVKQKDPPSTVFFPTMLMCGLSTIKTWVVYAIAIYQQRLDTYKYRQVI